MKIIIAFCFVVAFAAAGVASPAAKDKAHKVQKWTGDLVDSNCMTGALRAVPSAAQVLYPDPLEDYYQWVAESSQPMSGPEGTAQPPAQTTASPSAHNADPRDPEVATSENELALEAAEHQRTDMIRQRVAFCRVKTPTTHFGLVLSGGDFLKFDAAGDRKTLATLRSGLPEPGKKLKAKVTGILAEDQQTVDVASVELKGQGGTGALRKPDQPAPFAAPWTDAQIRFRGISPRGPQPFRNVDNSALQRNG